MKEMTASLAEASVAVVCLDEFREYDWTGRLYVRNRKEAYCFHGTLELLEQMERFYDSMDYPQASMNSRSFHCGSGGTEKKAGGYRENRKNEQPVVLSEQEIRKNRGKRVTFLVRVQYRQQATWQGQITWEEKGRTTTFRSVRELLRLIEYAEEMQENSRGGIESVEELLWSE